MRETAPEIFGKDIPRIRVIVRKRPLNKKESQKNEMDIIDIRNNDTIIVKELKYLLDKMQTQSRYD